MNLTVLKNVLGATLMVVCSASAYADGTSLGVDAVFTANLVREPVVQQCIRDVEQSKGLDAKISDIRSLENNGHEIVLTFRGGDVALSSVNLAVYSKTEMQPWGPV